MFCLAGRYDAFAAERTAVGEWIGGGCPPSFCSQGGVTKGEGHMVLSCLPGNRLEIFTYGILWRKEKYSMRRNFEWEHIVAGICLLDESWVVKETVWEIRGGI